MHTDRLRRTIAVVTSAAVLASLSVASVATPASAAKPKCFGKPATIVGTNKGERIVGTNKRDIIVAKGGADRIFGRGGNDLICGGGGADRIVGGPGIDKLLGNSGPDRLFGGPGPDRLFAGVGSDLLSGGPGRDVLDGGRGTDRCFQNLGTGPVVRCELPAPPPPAAPPPPEPPTLVIAYSDLNGNHGFDAGDVMISKIVDTVEDGVPSKGDSILMGRYPTSTNPGPADFADWGVKSHEIADIGQADLTEVRVTTTIGGTHWWWSDSPDPDQYDEYSEWITVESDFEDKVGTGVQDSLELLAGSPSQPTKEILETSAPGPGDDRFIDVEFYFTP